MLKLGIVSSIAIVSVSAWSGLAAAAENLPVPLVRGLKNPQSVAVGLVGKTFVTVAGELGKEGDGSVVRIDKDRAVPFATGLDDPRGIVAYRDALYVADRERIWKIDRNGNVEIYVGGDAFPSFPGSLGPLTADVEKGTLYVADSAPPAGHAALYRISTRRKVTAICDETTRPGFTTPSALLSEGASCLLAADGKQLGRLKAGDGSVVGSPVAKLMAKGLAWDHHGRLFASNDRDGSVLVIPRPDAEPVIMAKGFESPTGLCLDQTGRRLLVVDSKAGTLSSVKIAVPGWEIDEKPLAIEAVRAFPKIKWGGWTGETPEGRPQPQGPIVLTHAGDDSHRVFLGTQHGVIHVFPNDQNIADGPVFLDMQERVFYIDKENEEGFLGLAFHPKFKETGEFFVFYTPRKGGSPHTNVLSRFRVRKDDPNRADPASEEVLLRVNHPFYNHDGGTVAFGPDGFLYLALGDGGLADDPYGNGQNLRTLLGKILRIDVDHKENGQPYAIPKDNPFVGKPDARAEIWCYGLRNVWRFSFDRATGACWAADVGQNLWEEINLVVSGGNYGWNVREGLHPFSRRGSGPRSDLIDPIWEYHHNVGKSITGGHVYRGSRLPELQGAYLYADYVTGELRALRYDPEKKRVIANQLIHGPKLPVLSFGEDETGELYFLIVAADGRGIFRFEHATPKGPGPSAALPSTRRLAEMDPHLQGRISE